VRDPKRRPTINDLLKNPLIKPRIKRYLEEDSFMEEFSHTLLHNQDVFKAFTEKSKQEEEKKRQEDAQKEKLKQEEA